MRRLFLLLLTTFLLAATFSLASLDRRLDVQLSVERPLANPDNRTLTETLPLTRPIALDLSKAEHLHLLIQGFGADHVVVMKLEIEGGGGIDLVFDADERASRTQCFADEKSLCNLSLPITGNQPVSIRLVPNNGTVLVKQLGLEPVTSKRHVAATGLKIFIGFGVLLMAGPILVWLRRWSNAEQYALIIGGLIWVGYGSAFGLIASLCIVLLGYFFIIFINQIQKSRAQPLITVITIIVFLVLILKFATPILAETFANPGGLWLAFPLGISYLAIRIIDLLLAAYSRTLHSFNFCDYLAFVLLPHTLPAGPIQLYSDYLHSRVESYSWVDFSSGAVRMIVGLVKKLMADSILLPVVSTRMTLFLSGSGDTGVAVWMMLLGNLLYIYLDFSAYSDLAIGAARAGGRRLPENFDWPLFRSSVRSYWRSWHMTLSQWVMRRVYFPAFLISRSSVLALVASMFVIGMWHAPTTCWTLWAIHHSLILAVEGKLFPDVRDSRLPHSSIHLKISMAVKYSFGLIFMLFWVALGHSFTLFSDPKTALICYFESLSLPFNLIRNSINLAFM